LRKIFWATLFSSARQPNFSALSRGRHLYSALAHILVFIAIAQPPAISRTWEVMWNDMLTSVSILLIDDFTGKSSVVSVAYKRDTGVSKLS